MSVSSNTIIAESLGDFFKDLGKKGLNASKKWQKILKNLGSALQISLRSVSERTLVLDFHLEVRKWFYHRYQFVLTEFLFQVQKMTTPTLKLYLSPPFEKEGLADSSGCERNDLEQRLEKKLINVSSLNNSISNSKKLISFFENNNQHLKKKKNLKVKKCLLQY